MTNPYVTTEEALVALRIVTDALDSAAHRIRSLGQSEHPDIKAAIDTGNHTLTKAAGLHRWDTHGKLIEQESAP